MTLPAELTALFDAAVAKRASDIHLLADTVPRIRIYGDLVRLSELPPLTAGQIENLVLPLFPSFTQQGLKSGTIPMSEVLLAHGEFNFVVIASRSGGNISATVRILSAYVPTIAQIGYDCVDFFSGLAQSRSGLILISGPVGSGKQTTALAILQEINATQPRRIHLLEDSLSHRLQSEQGLVSSLLIGQDVPDYYTALRLLMRGGDPDVIFLNDLPDTQTVQSALTLARLGHLVIANANAPSATQALTTICRALLESDLPALSELLIAVTNQRLLRKSDGAGRIPAYEIVRNSDGLRESIRRGLDLEVVLAEMVAGSGGEETRTLPEVISRYVRLGNVSEAEADSALRDYSTL